MSNISKKMLYIDMDGVTANFDKRMFELCPELDIAEGDNYEQRSKMVDIVLSDHEPFFIELEPIDGAIDAINKLFDIYDTYFLSTPVDAVPSSFMNKRIWLTKHFGDKINKRLILTHRKDLVIGHYLIDDRTKNGVLGFQGKHLHFGSKDYPTWNEILKVLL